MCGAVNTPNWGISRQSRIDLEFNRDLRSDIEYAINIIVIHTHTRIYIIRDVYSIFKFTMSCEVAVNITVYYRLVTVSYGYTRLIVINCYNIFKC